MKSLLALCVFVLLMTSFYVYGESMAQVETNGVRVVLTNEPCKLTSVTNLPYRSTWTEHGKTIEGCFGMFGNQMVGFYFEDKSVAVIPARAFSRLSGV
jgi:hypothetical protein